MSLIPYDDDFFGFPSNFFDTQKMFKNPIKIDVVEKKDCFEVFADIPSGASKADIDSEFDNGYLSLNVSVKSDVCDCPSCKYVVKERFSGSYSRRFFVSDKVDRAGISASYSDGVLKFVIPKLPEVKDVNKSISID